MDGVVSGALAGYEISDGVEEAEAGVSGLDSGIEVG